jgi:hypothetical protein
VLFALFLPTCPHQVNAVVSGGAHFDMAEKFVSFRPYCFPRLNPFELRFVAGF